MFPFDLSDFLDKIKLKRRFILEIQNYEVNLNYSNAHCRGHKFLGYICSYFALTRNVEPFYGLHIALATTTGSAVFAATVLLHET